VPDKFTAMTAELHRYVVDHTREDDVLARLRAETETATDMAIMQIAPDQGALMALLARAIGARRALELGTFTGYSSICIARALPEGGRLVTCDVSEEWAGIALRYFVEAGVAERIDLRLGPALETLAELSDAEAEPFDFAFIDADKPNYPAYWEAVLDLLRPGGLVLVDNVFAGGSIVGESDGEGGFTHASLDTIRELNDRIAADARVEAAMVGIADGITIALKRQ
jgi:predicted O-methyltransferase YrrM